MKTRKRRPLLIIALILLSIPLLCALFIAGLYIYNQVSLKREAALIHPQGQFVEIDGKQMNIYTEGSGDKTLVFMAGANTPAVVYDFKPLYSRLSDTYRIAVVEKFGYGYSDDSDDERALSVMLRQDREALQKAGIEAPYILCPHSASGLEAIRWAQEYPDEVEAVIGLDMAVPEQFDYQIGDLNTIQPLTYEEAANEDAFFNFWQYDTGAYRLYQIGDVFPAAVSEDLTPDERAEYKAITYHWYSQFYKTAMYREGLPTAQQISDYKTVHDTPVPDVPTLQFVSSDAATFGAMLGENGLQKWKTVHENYISGLTNARIVPLDCGHYVHVEAPDKISTEIRAFLSDLPD